MPPNGDVKNHVINTNGNHATQQMVKPTCGKVQLIRHAALAHVRYGKKRKSDGIEVVSD